MSIPKSLNGTNRLVPELNETGWGENVTGYTVDLIDMVDGRIMLLSGQAIELCKAISTTLAGGATLTRTHQVHKVQGSGGAVTLSGTTAIANGTRDGEILILQGAHATNTISIQNNANVKLQGNVTLKQHDFIILRWDSTVDDWLEIVRGASAATLQSAYDAGAGITIGANGSVNIDRPTGGEVMRLRASTSGDPYLALLAGTAECRFLQVASGAVRIGTFSNHNLEFHTNNSAKVVVDTTGNVLINNVVAYQAKESGGTARDLAKLSAADEVILGSEPSTLILRTGNLEALRCDSSQRVAIGQTGAITAKLHVEQSANNIATRIFKTGTGAGNAVDIENEGTGIGLKVTQDGGAVAMQVVQNTANVGFNLSQTGNAGACLIQKQGTGAGDALSVDNDGTGKGLYVQQDAVATCAHFKQQSNAICLHLEKTATGAGTVLSINNAGTGKPIDTDAGGGVSAHLTTGGVWTDASCFASLKEDFEAVDKADFLAKIGLMSIQRYRSKFEKQRGLVRGVKDFGPLQDDLVTLFGLRDEGVRPVEVAAIALVGIQAIVDRLNRAGVPA